MKLTPSRRLYVLGAILFVALTICSRKLQQHGRAVLPRFRWPLLASRTFSPFASSSARQVSRAASSSSGSSLAALWHLAFLRDAAGVR